MVIVNDPAYGGSGKPGLATTHNGPMMVDIGGHEIAHQLGLNDEYTYTSELAATPGLPNCAASATETPWEPWRNIEEVGAFAGCGSASMFRAKHSCRMSALGEPFCPVCRQHIIKRLFELAGGAAGAISPDPTGVPIELPAQFAVAPMVDSTVRWKLDGVPVNEADDAHTFDPPGCAARVLEAEVHHATPWVIQDPDDRLTSTIRWPMFCAGGSTRTYHGDPTGPITDGSLVALKSSLVIEPGTWGRMRVTVRGQHEQPSQVAGQLRGPHGLRINLVFDLSPQGFAVSRLVPAADLGGTWTVAIVDTVSGSTGTLDAFDAVVELAAPNTNPP